MTFEEMIVQRETVKASSWSLKRLKDDDKGYPRFALYHYDTCMAQWTDYKTKQPAKVKSIDFLSTGIGSKTDQSGMNNLFDFLGVADKFYFSRKGGNDNADIIDVRDPKQIVKMPKYLRDWRASNDNPKSNRIHPVLFGC